MKTLKLFATLHVAWVLVGCGSDPDSSVICGARSKEAVFARSLSQTQLETLYANSIRLLASTDRESTYENAHSSSPRIPEQFAYLKPWRISTYSSDTHGYVSFTLKGCMDEFIHLRVENEEIALSYGLGGAPNVGTEVLWSANKELALAEVSSLAANEDVVAVAFELPGKPPVEVRITRSEVEKLTGAKVPYAVEFWVNGALSKARLRYAVEHIEGRRTITSIDDVWSGPAGSWVYFVDGTPATDRINIQEAPDVRSIRFAYEKTLVR